MSQTSPLCDMHHTPANWKPESYPSDDREWLAASFIAPSLHVGVAVLVAESLTGDGLVYPIAATSDINEMVDDRQYDLTDVACDRESAMAAARSLMDRFATTFADGGADFVETTLHDARKDARHTVRTPSDATQLPTDAAHESEATECSHCGGEIPESEPQFGAVEVGALDGSLAEYWCAECEFAEKPHSDEQFETIVIMTVPRENGSEGAERDWRVLRGR